MSVSFKTLDLNLLKVFDAVMEERSVLRASQNVALSQSAVSHSLARKTSCSYERQPGCSLRREL